MGNLINKTRMLTITMLLIGLAVVFSFSVSAVAADSSQIYVNTAGNDSWDGQYAAWNGTSGPKLTVKNATGTVATNGIVYIANGTYNEKGISIGRNMSIIGESRSGTIINGTNTGQIFSVSGGATVTFANLTLANGNASAGGGAISVSPGWYSSYLNVKNCIFKDNTARYTGGAIYSSGTGSSPSYVTITDSVFINNKVTQGNGGAIYNGGLGPLTITNSDFSGNTASGTGNVLYSALASPSTIQFSRISGTGTSLIAIQSGAPGTDASLNWWGSNADPTSKVAAGVTVGPWLILTAPTDITLAQGSSSLIAANLQYDSDGFYHDPVFEGHVPDGIPVTFAGDALGNVNPLTGTTSNGLLITNFTAGAANGVSNPTFTIDGQGVSGNVNIADVIPTSLAVDPVSGNPGNWVDLTATLTDTQNNQPVIGAIVDFFVKGSYIGNAITDDNGLAIMPYYIYQGAGIYQILAQFVGDATYSGSTGTDNLTVNPISTNLVVTNPSSGYQGDSVNIIATLTDANNVPLAGQKVLFSANGISLGTATTNGLGIATLPYTLTLGAGNYQILAQFLGDDIYTSSTATNGIIVNPTSTSLTVDPKSVVYNSYVYLTATLRDTVHNVVLSGTPVSFYVNGVLMGTTTTGSLYVSNVALTPGNYEILAQFAGDAGYLASSGTNTLTVNYIPTSITVVPKTGYYGDTVTLNATLRNSQTSGVLSGKTVNFTVNGVSVGSAVTNASGVAVLPYTIALPGGIYQILAQFAGDTTYNATSGNNTLTVNSTSTSLAVDPVSGYKNDVVSLTATLKDSLHNIPLAGQQVNFTVNGISAGSAVTDASGIATLQYTITQSTGTYQILAQFAGSTSYNATNATNSLTVNQTPTSIVVNPLTGYYGDVVDLVATLTDTHSNVPVNGAAVNFTVNGSVIGTATTDASGVATMPYTIALTTGTYQILAQFAGDTIYSTSSAINNLIVNNIPTSAIINPLSGYKGNIIDLTATLTDLHNNIPVSGKTVSFTVNGVSAGSALTNASGIAILPYTIALNPGSYLILAQFMEDNVYSGSTGTSTLNVNPTPNKIVVNAVNGIKGSVVSLTATLTDNNSVPISGKTINFSVNGSPAGSAVTDASGVATLTYTTTQNAGTYQILAQFAGDIVYPASEGTNNLTVSLMPTQIAVNSPNGLKGSKVNLTATLKDTNNVPLSGKTVNFRVNGSLVGSAVTNASGVATLSYTITLNAGIYAIRAEFAGDASNAASNGANNLTVRENIPPTITAVDPVKNAVNVATNKVIKVTFSESIKMGTGWIELLNSNGKAVPITTSISGNVLTIKPNSALAKGTKYTIAIHTGSITDLSGNNVAGYVSSFTTDGTKPTIKRVDPANNAVKVPANKVIKVTFSESIKMGTGWIELLNSNGKAVPITTSISGSILTIKPNSNLPKGKYTIALHTGSITDLSGNPNGAWTSVFTV